MKKTKVCPECKKCNHKLSNSCVKCNANLSKVIQIEVEDDLEFYIEKNENVVIEQTENTLENIKTCPQCGQKNSVENIICSNQLCNFILSKNVEEEFVAKTRQINLSLIIKNSEIKLIPTGDINFFGRNSFDLKELNENKYISRKHFEFYLIKNNVYIKDISTNGTKLNSQAMDKNKEYKLQDSDILTLFNLSFKVKIYEN